MKDGGRPGRAELLEGIRDALAPLAIVEAALLFGSQATGHARPESDIDIAVLLEESAARADRLAVIRTLLEALAARLPIASVDLVVLNDAPTKLAFLTLKDGQVAFDRTRTPLHRFRVRTYDRHADYAPVERFFREAIKRRALTGLAVSGAVNGRR